MREDVRQAVTRAAVALRQFGAREVYVFGSAAGDQWRQDSDIDLAVSGLPPSTFFRALSRAREALGGCSELDLIDLDDDTPFTRYLREEGELQRVA